MNHDLVVLVLAVLLQSQGVTGSFLVDPDAPGKMTYDGHGALSAGASSRLLYDYDEPQRSEILDYLFKPNFGASLHLIKIEIGGDSQSTDGTEASHMHNRDDLECDRGYEWWLLEEAKKRNPEIKTSALSWAVPSWVGNDTFFSKDNIEYHMRWMDCARDHHPSVLPIDYLGIWNERSWGSASYVKGMREALDNGGYRDTKLVLPDAGLGTKDETGQITIEQALDSDPEFSAAVDTIGLHYPCDTPAPEVREKYSLKYISSEDFSTVSDWDGAGCWGRILSTNVVRMNMTSTIAWSLVWSVYDDFPYFGNGLMYAMRPWSNHYKVNEAIWTSAHHTQFTQVGWSYVGGQGGRADLPGGGSFVALVSPDYQDVTIVVEKLHGDCLRCKGYTNGTTAESVQFELAPSLASTFGTLSVWSTNKTNSFERLPDVNVGGDGMFTVRINPDSILTISSTSGQRKGGFPSSPIPPDASFPLPYSDDFESRDVRTFAAYFADNGGSWEIAEGVGGRDGHVLEQVVELPPHRNAWVQDRFPITVIGDNATKSVSVDLYLPASGGADCGGACVHVSAGGGAERNTNGHCIYLCAGGSSWYIEEAGFPLASGELESPVAAAWHSIGLAADGNGGLSGSVDGKIVAHVTAKKVLGGRAALACYWGKACFDNFRIE